MGRKRQTILQQLIKTAAFRRLLGIMVAVLLILYVSATAANAVAGDAHPTLRFYLAWLLVTAWVCALVGGWLAWRRRRRTRVEHLKDLLALTPRQFEQAIGDLLIDLGYRSLRHTGASGDLAADLICKDPAGHSVAVQCKRYAPGTRVGSPDVQKFIGMIAIHHRTDRGIFVTTASFTEPARSLAAEHAVELLDGERLTALITGARERSRSVRQTTIRHGEMPD